MAIGRNCCQTRIFCVFYVLTLVHNEFITPPPRHRRRRERRDQQFLTTTE